MLLKLLLTLSEEESRNISERTKLGNQASARANKIRNNELYGYDFDRKSNSLIAIEEEAEVVRLMFKLCMEGNGYRTISHKLTEMNLLNRKGKPFSTSTIKNMLHNQKYYGFNVKGIWQSVGLFTEDHTSKKTKKEEWLVQKNDRIEPIISEDTFEKAHKAINERLLHGNKGKNISKRDTQGKIICANCGKSYYICHSKSLGSAINTNPYYICATKKNKGKVVCNAENLSLKQIEKYLEDLRLHYYDNVELRNKIKIQQLKDELSSITNATDSEVLNKIKDNNLAIKTRQETIDQLLDKFVSNATESTKNLIEKKISSIEEEVSKLEAENNSLDELLRNKEAEKNKIKHKIQLLERTISKS
ncbi:MAG: recombinase family protein [Clostridium sp.]